MKAFLCRPLICAAVICSLASPAAAAETIAYTYDARGRLVQVDHTGTVNNLVTTKYTYDKADNRTNKTTAPTSDKN